MTSVNTSNNYSNVNSSYGAAAGGGLDMNAFWNEVRFSSLLPSIAPLKLTVVFGGLGWIGDRRAKPPAHVQRQCEPHCRPAHALLEQHWRPRRAATDRRYSRGNEADGKRAQGPHQSSPIPRRGQQGRPDSTPTG